MSFLFLHLIYIAFPATICFSQVIRRMLQPYTAYNKRLRTIRQYHTAAHMTFVRLYARFSDVIREKEEFSYPYRVAERNLSQEPKGVTHGLS